jgi:hypothetical protein
MLALAFLTIAAVTAPQQPAAMIPLTRNEIAHLAAALVLQPRHDVTRRLRWSARRRRHQHRAMTCHYNRQARKDP